MPKRPTFEQLVQLVTDWDRKDVEALLDVLRILERNFPDRSIQQVAEAIPKLPDDAPEVHGLLAIDETGRVLTGGPAGWFTKSGKQFARELEASGKVRRRIPASGRSR